MKIEKFSGDYRWLSNFCVCSVVLDGETYITTEHAYQAAKTLDITERNEIRQCKTPGMAKKLGKYLTVRDDWDDIKISVMTDLLEQKFSKPEFYQLLISTGDNEIVEGNSWNDYFWGVCDGIGSNHLGKIIMDIREKLRN